MPKRSEIRAAVQMVMTEYNMTEEQAQAQVAEVLAEQRAIQQRHRRKEVVDGVGARAANGQDVQG